MSTVSGPGRSPFWAIWRRRAPLQADATSPLPADDAATANQAGRNLFSMPREPAAAGEEPAARPVEVGAETAGAGFGEAPGTTVGAPDAELGAFRKQHNGVGFLVPGDLAKSDIGPRRVALVGSCFLSAWNIHGRHAKTCTFDVFTVNHGANLPDRASGDSQADDYDFQIIQLPMRSFLPDGTLSLLAYGDLAGHEAAFEAARGKLAFLLKTRMKWNIGGGLLTFITNFPVPQRNMMGALFPRYDIRNPEHFVHKLNEALETMVRSYGNAYVLDVDRICASYGRRYIQDDIVATVTHNSILGLEPPNLGRMERMGAMGEHYDVEWPKFLADSIWAEATAMFRTVRQADSVKMVILDLDDTLWHGVSGDTQDVGGHMLAGWPSGLAEALLYLKKRGVLLAIVSKNDETRVRAIWPKIFQRSLDLEDFAAIRINWRPKAENIREILGMVNLLPRNVVFIDDNPGERAAVGLEFPDIRVLGRHPYYFRRVLLWSAETQNAAVSHESGSRTEMVQAQMLREDARQELSREAFLAAAAPRVEIGWITGTGDARFGRVLELVNKTNQFNTTGVRRSREELELFFAEGGRVLAFDVTDRFTAYGLVGAVLVKYASIEQWVMSCRVLGLEVELAVMSDLLHQLQEEGYRQVSGLLVETEVNAPCRDLFARCDFRNRQGVWKCATRRRPAMPAHVEVVGGQQAVALT